MRAGRREGAGVEPCNTDGRILGLDPEPADVQERDGDGPIPQQWRRSLPFIAEAFATAGDAEDRSAIAALIAAEIVPEPPGGSVSGGHPRRWVAERFFAWTGRARRPW